MITDQTLAVAEVARRLDVGANLRQWKKAFRDRGEAAVPGHGNPPPAGDELRRRRAEITRLKAERDVRKNAAAYFANPPRGRSGSSPATPIRGRSGACARPWRCRPAGPTPGLPGPTGPRRQGRAAAIKGVHAAANGRSGSPRMAAELTARGPDGSADTAAGRMRAHGVRAMARKRLTRTTDSSHRLPVAENLPNRDFTPPGPNVSWSADIPDVPTRDGWRYPAAVEDLFARRIVGWSVAETVESRLVVDALEMAVARRHPGGGRSRGRPTGRSGTPRPTRRRGRVAAERSAGGRGDGRSNRGTGR